METPARHRLVLLAGAAVALPPLLAGLWPGDEATRLARLVVGYGLAGLPWLLVASRWRDLAPGRPGLRAVLLVALLARLTLLLVPPVLSEDLWRYIWDGAVQAHGLPVYGLAPASPALDVVVEARPALAAVRAQIGHPEIPTIYPPAAQAAFGLVARLTVDPLGWRLLAVLLDLVAIAALAAWAAALGRDPRLVALYAFAPLPMLESAVGAHVDVLGVAALLAAGALLATARPVRAGLALAVGVGAKLLPLLAVAGVVRRSPRAVWAAGAGLLLLALPHVTGEGDPLAGFRAYAHRWRGNEGAFAALAWPFERALADHEGSVDLPAGLAAAVGLLVGGSGGGAPWPDQVAFAAAKALALLLLGLVVAERLWRSRDLEGFLGPCIAAVLLLSPVVHPWYLLWILPFAALAADTPGWRRGAPFFLWSLLAWAAYVPRIGLLRTGSWSPDPIWAAFQYVPVWIGLFTLAWRELHIRTAGRPGQ